MECNYIPPSLNESTCFPKVRYDRAWTDVRVLEPCEMAGKNLYLLMDISFSRGRDPQFTFFKSSVTQNRVEKPLSGS